MQALPPTTPVNITMPKMSKILVAIWEEGPDILVILAITFLANFIVRRTFRGVKNAIVERMNKRSDVIAQDTEKNVKTIEAVLGRTVSLLIWGGAILAILKRIKVDTSAIVTGASVIGLAVGFGSQTLIKDVIAGLFLLIENQIRVNDSAQINGVAGTVEEVNLRTTVLRAENGGLHIFPNGSITALANLSREFAHYLFEFLVVRDTNIEKASAIMTETIEEMRQEDAYKNFILAPIEVYGVDRVMEQGLVLKGRVKTMPHKQWGVGRDANLRIMRRFEAAGIQLASREMNVKMDGPVERAELKALVRQVVKEMADEGKA